MRIVAVPVAAQEAVCDIEPVDRCQPLGRGGELRRTPTSGSVPASSTSLVESLSERRISSPASRTDQARTSASGWVSRCTKVASSKPAMPYQVHRASSAAGPRPFRMACRKPSEMPTALRSASSRRARRRCQAFG